MFPTQPLLTAARVTLFTRVGCGLCDTAKHTVTQLNKRKPFDYSELDIMIPENKPWKDVYEFDVPVLHVQSTIKQSGKTELSDPKKLFHRFTEQEVENLVDEAEQAS
ncbi:glutaredoxin domain-containing protein [Aspergillus sclerotialis]|uniref:Glutaredoxin-like protein n=1 Tax=Aspergillus sclerotialis TaxID=2070753 RepID=A0A3A2ZKU9_9EURO|nr:glutaredoxin domain-containing protein [Aspergillus sclerotialis]